ncbi:MAG: penicillin-binding protein 1C, partial [Spirochaetales bacterium]|nr:penicillin-binding protein 1C [Spirochaetales bacterium]
AGEVVSGGSTLTMQAVRLSRQRERTYSQKFLEIFLALKWEIHLSKKEILELYAAHAPFGGNIVGLEAAAYRYFGTDPDNLSWSESALLAVLPNAPSLMYPGKNNPELQEKRDNLLRKLYQEGILDRDTLELALDEGIPERLYPFPREAEHLLLRARAEGLRGQAVPTTLDRYLQQKAAYVLEKHHRRLRVNGIENGACLILETGTGRVLAYVGNTEPAGEENANQVDNISASRSTGSLLKPFLYASMLDEGLLLPHQLIADYALSYHGFRPENYHHSFEGAVPASQALIQSLNVPMVALLEQYGIEKFHNQLSELGFSLPFEGGHYGLTLIVGGAESSLWDLSALYAGMGRSLINYNEEGEYFKDDYRPNTWRTNLPLPQSETRTYPPLHAGAIWKTLEVMKEVIRPDEESGWIRYSSSSPMAWKTGTSWGYRDSWSIGVTPEYTIAVWIGNSSGEGRPGNTGSQAAAPVLFDLADILPATGWFATPYEDLTKQTLCKESGMLCGPHCENTVTELVPLSAAEGETCPYHRTIHLDETETYRVDSSVYPVDKMVSRSWFVLPPIQEWYYQYRHSDYKKLPPLLPGTLSPDQEERLQWIYPAQNSRVIIPIEVDGSQGKVLLQAAHRLDGEEIHWFMDGEYLTTTERFHQVEVSPGPGEHRLAIVDNGGSRKTTTLVVE